MWFYCRFVPIRGAILFRWVIFKYGVASGGVRVSAAQAGSQPIGTRASRANARPRSSSVSTRYGVVTPFALRQQTVFSLPCLDKATGCVRIPLLRLQSFARSHSEDSAPPPFATHRNSGLTELSGPLDAPFSKYTKIHPFINEIKSHPSNSTIFQSQLSNHHLSIAISQLPSPDHYSPSHYIYFPITIFRLLFSQSLFYFPVTISISQSLFYIPITIFNNSTLITVLQ